MDETAGIYARDIPFLGCAVQIGLAQERVLSVDFPSTAPAEAESEHPLLDRIAAYLEGTEDDFSDVTIALTVPTDQRKILEVVREIPFGEQVSVEQLARMTAEFDPDDEADLTVIREALDGNPAPILIPDHRVRDGPSGAPAGVEQKLRAIEDL